MSAHIEWDFRAGPNLADASGHGLTLAAVGGVVWRPDSVTGGAMEFDGTGHLCIPAASAGELDVSAAGDRVSVMALVRRESTSTGFIAGMWQEHDDDPRRQYGLFTSLPTYGGDQQVCGHVSSDGHPSGELPYSRDYAASDRTVPLGSWHVVGFTYDGQRIIAWLDGTADDRPSYTEPQPPLGAGMTYPKNPYLYAGGLNRLTTSDFTVGGVMLTSGMGNMFIGAIARLAVFSDALDEGSVVELSREWSRPSMLRESSR